MDLLEEYPFRHCRRRDRVGIVPRIERDECEEDEDTSCHWFEVRVQFGIESLLSLDRHADKCVD